MNDFNFDENTINKVKNMMDNGELSDVMSKISPEMLQNFSTMLNSNSSSNNSGNAGNSSNSSKSESFNKFNNSSKQSGFDFSNIDMNTIMKMKSIMDKMNNRNDPRSNLLNSLKPYLREEKRGKLDQYANLMNVAKIAELLKDEEKGNN